MFKIIGGDGKEYGPVSVDKIRSWIAAGRANLDTQARREGETEWKPLGEFDEFGGAELPPVIGVPAVGAVPVSTPSFVNQEPASHGARLGGALLNALLYFISLIPGSIMAAMQLIKTHPDLARSVMPDISALSGSEMMHAVLWVYVGPLAAMVVQIVLIGVRGQSVGKLVAGTKVVRLDGSSAGFARGSFARYLVPVVVFLVLFAKWPLLGLLFLAVDFGFMFRSDRRCLHDLMAGTKVVKAD